MLKRAVDNANRELAPFQQIRYWLRWPQPEFPRTSTGKVLRRWCRAGRSSRWRPAARVWPLRPAARGVAPTGSGQPGNHGQRSFGEDLHLDSLAMVQLQSTLETRFGLELDDASGNR
jgi:long-chain acyl-CoA synthetase